MLIGASSNAQAAAPTQITAGSLHSCALLSGGTIKCWGFNNYGQLGDGTTTSKPVPVSVTGVTAATQVVGGYNHTCALLANGTIKCWGWNSSGQLGDGTTTDRATPVSVKGITTATQVAGGYYHSCALLEGGTVKCWGFNGNGQLGTGTTTDRATPVGVTGITTATQITSGATHTCALLANGTARCWGNNELGQLGDATTIDRYSQVGVTGITAATQIASGGDHSCALLANGTIKCWGWNGSGELGGGSFDKSLQRANVADITSATQVASGPNHSCARLADGTLKCWGSNRYGLLGDGTTASRSAPVSVTGLKGARQVAGGILHTCTMLASGTLKCWGRNWAGQLGDGSTIDRITPVGVVGIITKPNSPGLSRTPTGQSTNQGITITIRAIEGATLTCTLDGAEAPSCETSIMLTNLSDGTHTFAVSQSVAGYEAESDAATITWTVDTKAPAAPALTGKPNALTNVTTANFSISAEQGATLTCALDSDTYASCASRPSFANLSDGPHNLKVQQTDQAGNTSRAAAYSWTIDTVAPTAPPITSGPPAKTNLTTAAFTFTNPDLAVLSCSLDGAAFRSCASGITYQALAEGKHTFQVRTTDPAGNTAISTQTWSVDTTPPILAYSARGGKIKTNTSTSYQLIVSPDPSGISAVEYSTTIAAPSLVAKNVASQTIPFAEPTVFTTTAAIRWIRLQDGAGNWSRWFIA